MQKDSTVREGVSEAVELASFVCVVFCDRCPTLCDAAWLFFAVLPLAPRCLCLRSSLLMSH